MQGMAVLAVAVGGMEEIRVANAARFPHTATASEFSGQSRVPTTSEGRCRRDSALTLHYIILGDSKHRSGLCFCRPQLHGTIVISGSPSKASTLNCPPGNYITARQPSSRPTGHAKSYDTAQLTEQAEAREGHGLSFF